jgi:hypothetical protein
MDEADPNDTTKRGAHPAALSSDGKTSEPAEDLQFTAESVKALLRTHVFRNTGPLAGLVMPTPEALAELAADLDSLRDYFRAEIGFLQKSREITERFSSAFSEIEAALPGMVRLNLENQLRGQRLLKRIREADEKHIQSKYSDPRIVSRAEMASTIKSMYNELKEQQVSLEALSSAVTDTRRHNGLFGSGKPMEFRRGHPMNHWHGYTHAIAGSLQETIWSRNPDALLGVSSNNGPIPRFIAAVLPMITGDKLTASGVGKWLKSLTRIDVATPLTP